MNGNALLFMIKEPVAGRVKTRLGAEIGMGRACEIHRRFVERLVREVIAVPEAGWTAVLAYDPADAESRMRDWLGGMLGCEALLIAQTEGDLGHRLEDAFRRSFDAGADRVVAIGADCLDLGPEDIVACFESLRRVPVTFGPATDGGYWCIGMAGRHFELFRDMPWSTEALAEETRRRAATAGLAVIEQPEKADVDHAADLARLPPAILREIGYPP